MAAAQTRKGQLSTLMLCGYGESNPDLVLGKDAFYH